MSATVVARVIEPEQRETFLSLVREGRNRKEAAEAIGWTGTKMRQLIGRDEDLRREFEEAWQEGRGEFATELVSELRRRLLDEKTGSDALLRWALAAYDEDWRFARGHPSQGEPGDAATDFRLAPPLIDVSKLTDAQMQKLDESLRTVEFLVGIGQGRIANPDLPASGAIEAGEAA